MTCNVGRNIEIKFMNVEAYKIVFSVSLIPLISAVIRRWIFFVCFDLLSKCLEGLFLFVFF